MKTKSRAASAMIDVPLKLTKAQIDQLSGAAKANGCTIGELVYALAAMQLDTCYVEENPRGELMTNLWLYSAGRFEPRIQREWLSCGFREKDVEAEREFKVEVPA